MAFRALIHHVGRGVVRLGRVGVIDPGAGVNVGVRELAEDHLRTGRVLADCDSEVPADPGVIVLGFVGGVFFAPL